MLGGSLLLAPRLLWRSNLLGLAITRNGITDTLVPLELPRRQPGLEHFGNLLQRAVLNLWHVPEDECRCDQAGREPDVSVLWTPVQGCWVDKVWCGEPVEEVSVCNLLGSGGGVTYVASHAPKKPTEAPRPKV